MHIVLVEEVRCISRVDRGIYIQKYNDDNKLSLGRGSWREIVETLPPFMLCWEQSEM